MDMENTTLTHNTAISSFADCFDMNTEALRCARVTLGGFRSGVLKSTTSASEGAPVWLCGVNVSEPIRIATYYAVVTASFDDDEADEPTCHVVSFHADKDLALDSFRKAAL